MRDVLSLLDRLKAHLESILLYFMSYLYSTA
ncbi:hypothetical protein Hc94105_1531 [Helicobacter cinaedi]|nr:hypothetical protein Hc94105_1531 [Helicobacter cinaedi]